MGDVVKDLHCSGMQFKVDIAVADHGPKRDLTNPNLSQIIHMLQYKDKIKQRGRTQ